MDDTKHTTPQVKPLGIHRAPGGIWYAEIERDGVRRHFSLRTKDAREAEEIWSEYRAIVERASMNDREASGVLPCAHEWRVVFSDDIPEGFLSCPNCGGSQPMPRPIPTDDEQDTAHEIALMWGFDDNPAFHNVVAMALLRARLAERGRCIEKARERGAKSHKDHRWMAEDIEDAIRDGQDATG